MFFIKFGGPWLDLGLGKLGRHLFYHLLLFGQSKVHFMSIPP